MSAKHTNYNRSRREPPVEHKTELVKEQESTQTETVIGDEPKRYVYDKTTPIPIRIRTGPGFSYEHNGKYIDTQKKVEFCEIENGWGLLADHAETRDAWVCLSFLDGSTD